MRAIHIAATRLFAAPSLAWHDPVHALITRAALLSLPAEASQFWGVESDRLITRYSLYPDEYYNASAERKAAMRPYCEMKGRAVHNVAWKRAEDIESLDTCSGDW